MRRSLFAVRGVSSYKDTAKTVLCLVNLIVAASLLRGLYADSGRTDAPNSTLAVLLATVYAGAITAQVIGIGAAALSDHMRALRVDIMISMLASVAVLICSLVRTVVLVALYPDIVDECVALATHAGLPEREGIWGPVVPGAQQLAAHVAVRVCDIQTRQNVLYEVLILAVSLTISALIISTIVYDNICKDREDAEALILDDAHDPLLELDKPEQV